MKRDGVTRARLRELYARLPAIECKGLCHESCGPIEMSPVEQEIVERRTHRPFRTAMTCPLLVDNRCSVYSDRPMICRLWGVSISMPCPHGCRPEGGLLSHEETWEFLAASLEIGGGMAGQMAATLRENLSDPRIASLARKIADDHRFGV